MELRKFIKTTLEEIADGVSDAKLKFKELGGEVNPEGSGMKQGKQTVNIEFEVSLADSTTSSKGGKIGVLLSIVSVEAAKENENAIRSMTKVEFSVPVILP